MSVIVLGVEVEVHEVESGDQLRCEVGVIRIRAGVEHGDDRPDSRGDVPGFGTVHVGVRDLIERVLIHEEGIIGNVRPSLSDPVRLGELDAGEFLKAPNQALDITPFRDVKAVGPVETVPAKRGGEARRATGAAKGVLDALHAGLQNQRIDFRESRGAFGTDRGFHPNQKPRSGVLVPCEQRETPQGADAQREEPTKHPLVIVENTECDNQRPRAI